MVSEKIKIKKTKVGLDKQLQSYLNNFASYFKKSKSHSVGVEIGGGNLKLVELKKKKGRIELKNYALVKIKKDFSRKETRAMSGGLIEKILKDTSIKIKEINLSIPSHSALITLIEVSGQSSEEIKREVEYEADKYIPINLEDAVFDWQVIDNDQGIVGEKKENKKHQKDSEQDAISEGNDVSKKVLLVSTMKSISNEYQKSLNKEKLSVGSIEIDCFATKRALLRNLSGNYVVLDIGKKVTNVSGIYRGQLLFNRNIDLAGQRITELIAKEFKISEKRAEKLKIEKGFELDSETAVKNILNPLFNSIIEQTQKNLNKFEEFKKNGIEKIVLTGGTSKMKGLKEYFQRKMKKEVVYGNPWIGIDYPKEIEKNLMALAPFFSVAVGLALIDFDDE